MATSEQNSSMSLLNANIDLSGDKEFNFSDLEQSREEAGILNELSNKQDSQDLNEEDGGLIGHILDDDIINFAPHLRNESHMILDTKKETVVPHRESKNELLNDFLKFMDDSDSADDKPSKSEKVDSDFKLDLNSPINTIQQTANPTLENDAFSPLYNQAILEQQKSTSGILEMNIQLKRPPGQLLNHNQTAARNDLKNQKRQGNYKDVPLVVKTLLQEKTHKINQHPLRSQSIHHKPFQPKAQAKTATTNAHNKLQKAKEQIPFSNKRSQNFLINQPAIKHLKENQSHSVNRLTSASYPKMPKTSIKRLDNQSSKALLNIDVKQKDKQTDLHSNLNKKAHIYLQNVLSPKPEALTQSLSSSKLMQQSSQNQPQKGFNFKSRISSAFSKAEIKNDSGSEFYIKNSNEKTKIKASLFGTQEWINKTTISKLRNLISLNKQSSANKTLGKNIKSTPDYPSDNQSRSLHVKDSSKPIVKKLSGQQSNALFVTELVGNGTESKRQNEKLVLSEIEGNDLKANLKTMPLNNPQSSPYNRPIDQAPASTKKISSKITPTHHDANDSPKNRTPTNGTPKESMGKITEPIYGQQSLESSLKINLVITRSQSSMNFVTKAFNSGTFCCESCQTQWPNKLKSFLERILDFQCQLNSFKSYASDDLTTSQILEAVNNFNADLSVLLSEYHKIVTLQRLSKNPSIRKSHCLKAGNPSSLASSSDNFHDRVKLSLSHSGLFDIVEHLNLDLLSTLKQLVKSADKFTQVDRDNIIDEISLFEDVGIIAKTNETVRGVQELLSWTKSAIVIQKSFRQHLFRQKSSLLRHSI